MGTPRRLAGSTSPYLLDHADNPVEWWAWGEEAFAEARRRDVPIFLSIGYSTCYWCHVMARESFENPDVAAVLNKHFVCIKVDREERPDLDDVYMAATLVSVGHGGWPMTVFIEPERLRPFYCGTYFPAKTSTRTGTMPSLPELVEGISHSWKHDRKRVIESAEAIASAVQEELAKQQTPMALTPVIVERATQALLATFDRVDGGFGGGGGTGGQGPKFPQPTNLEFLLELRGRVENVDAQQAMDAAIKLTLDKMACGGVFDQVGGGFHRYSVDRQWQVPHFEKMLSDNAQLLAIYARAAKVYDSPDYERVARQIGRYIEREMTAPDGAFYSAQDAEVDGREGQNYVWTPEEAQLVLGERGEQAMEWYGLDRSANFYDPHHPNEAPVHVLVLDALPTELATSTGKNRSEIVEMLDEANERLLCARGLRKQPKLDDKVIASWTGLMISGLAQAAGALGDRELLARAVRGCGAVLDRLVDADGGLLRVSRDGRAHTPGFLEDYAMVVGGLAATVRTGRMLGEPCEELLSRAIELAEQAEARLGASDGGYFDVGSDQSELFVRPRTSHDSAMPTGQSAMLHTLLDLYELTEQREWCERAIRALRAMSEQIATRSVASLNATRALLRVFDDAEMARQAHAFGPAAEAPRELVAGDPDFTPVEVYADRELITVGEDSPAELWLELRIASGFHVVAGAPGSNEAAQLLEPMRVFQLEGAGLGVYADYPEGDLMGEGEDAVRVYSRSARIRIGVELLDREVAGRTRALLGVRFQACDERSCQRATTVELDVSVEISLAERDQEAEEGY